MRAISAIAGGLAGALTVAIIHQILKKLDDEAPHLDALGLTSAASKGQGNFAVSQGGATTAGAASTSLLGNALYYGMSGYGEKRMDNKKGLLSHAEGIGALYGPKLIGGSESTSNPAEKHSKVTSFLHSLGGFVATKIMDFIEDYFQKKHIAKITGRSSQNHDYSASGY